MGQSPAALAAADSADPRRGRVQAACQAWVARLDRETRLGNLLLFLDHPAGSLEIEPPALDAVSPLLQGGRIEMLRLLPSLASRHAELRAVERQAWRNFEEHGVATLHLAVGVASWRGGSDGGLLSAPLLLLPVELRQGGPQAVLRAAGEPAVNPAFLHVLAADRGRTIGAAEILGGGGELPLGPLQAARRLFAQIPEFQVAERCFLGNFSWHALEALDEIRGAEDRLAQHAVIAELLGGDDRRQAPIGAKPQSAQARAQAPGPRPAIVLPADTSQRRALDAALRGESCVIEGAPGSGKSQTIANLVAALLADGQRVLVVAQKRAALDAVQQRLRTLGLDRLLLDIGTRDAPFGADVAQVLAELRAQAAAGGPAPHVDDLARRRAELEARRAELYAERRPPALSLIDIWTRIWREPAAVRQAGIAPHPELRALEWPRLRHVMQLMADAHDLGDLLTGRSDSPWAGARLDEQDDARRAVGLAYDALAAYRRVERLLQALGGLQQAAGPRSLADLSAMLRLAQEIGLTSELYAMEVWQLDLGPLAQALRQGGATRLGAQARAALRERRRNPHAGAQTIAREAARLQDLSEGWQRFMGRADAHVDPIDARRLEQALEAFDVPCASLAALFPDADWTAQPLDGLVRRIEAMTGDLATPHRIPRARAVARELESHGAAQAAWAIMASDLSPAVWPQALEFLWLGAWLEDLQSGLALGTESSGRTSDALARQIAELDVQERAAWGQAIIELQAGRIARVAREFPGQAEVVRDGAPLRELLRTAPQLLLSLHPCWLASPHAIGRLIDDDLTPFDVVVFDEASQVPVERAVPAILRGRRLVVAGDPRQLRPAPFLADGRPGPADVTAEAYESLLDLAMQLPHHTLDRHYRSRDEALFAFSNHHIYGGGLLTAPGRLGHGAGLEHVLVPAAGGVGALDAEVRAVAELVLRHAEEHPEKSLGVIAFDPEHLLELERALDRARAADLRLEALFAPDRPEPFFAKEAAATQGEERDAVIVTFGCDRLGRSRGGEGFGGLAAAGGERRLNVALTRARERMALVSAFGFADVPQGDLPPGVALLRDLLQYAAERSGGRLAERLTDEAVNPLEEELEAFQEDVYAALRQAGMDLVPQYGALRHRMDFAARHPGRQGEYVLAIACDGQESHRAPTTRQIDRQRQLEGLGWRWHTIWLADWARDRGGEIGRAMAAWERAAAQARDLSWQRRQVP